MTDDGKLQKVRYDYKKKKYPFTYPNTVKCPKVLQNCPNKEKLEDL